MPYRLSRAHARHASLLLLGVGAVKTLAALLLALAGITFPAGQAFPLGFTFALVGCVHVVARSKRADESTRSWLAFKATTNKQLKTETIPRRRLRATLSAEIEPLKKRFANTKYDL